jgi:membrane protein
VNKALHFLRQLAGEINRVDTFNGAAALGFYLTLAIFPATILVMAVLPYLPIDRVDQAIMDFLQQALPGTAAAMFSGVVEQVTSEQRGGLLSFGIVGTVWAASTGMYAVMRQMNVAYQVPERRPFVKARLVALGLSLLFLLLVIGAFSLIVLGGVVQDWLGARFGFSPALLAFFATLRWMLIAAALLLGFAFIYAYAPNVKRRLSLLTPGGVLGVVLLVVASLGFSWYLARFANYDAVYGSIGAVIVLMLWLYIAGFVILLGAEVNVLRERWRGGRPRGPREAPAAAG